MSLSIYRPQTVPSGPLHCFPLEAWFWDPSHVSILDTLSTFLSSLSASFPDQKEPRLGSPHYRPHIALKAFTVKLWIPEHPREVGDRYLTWGCRGQPQPLDKEQCSKRRTNGSDRRSCSALLSRGLITSLWDLNLPVSPRVRHHSAQLPFLETPNLRSVLPCSPGVDSSHFHRSTLRISMGKFEKDLQGKGQAEPKLRISFSSRL